LCPLPLGSGLEKVCCCSGESDPIRIPERRAAGWVGVDPAPPAGSSRWVPSLEGLVLAKTARCLPRRRGGGVPAVFPGDGAEHVALAAAREVAEGAGHVRLRPCTACTCCACYPQRVAGECLTCASSMTALVHLWHVHNWHWRWPGCTLRRGRVTRVRPGVGRGVSRAGSRVA
jgi:hypothetical protein